MPLGGLSIWRMLFLIGCIRQRYSYSVRANSSLVFAFQSSMQMVHGPNACFGSVAMFSAMHGLTESINLFVGVRG